MLNIIGCQLRQNGYVAFVDVVAVLGGVVGMTCFK